MLLFSPKTLAQMIELKNVTKVTLKGMETGDLFIVGSATGGEFVLSDVNQIAARPFKSADTAFTLLEKYGILDFNVDMALWNTGVS